MKYKSKWVYLLWLLVLSWISVLYVTNIVKGDINISVPSETDVHRAILHSLFLWNWNSDDSYALIELNDEQLKIKNWVIMGTGNEVSDSITASIGWWSNNKIYKDNSGIWWWKDNMINTSSSVIWGWQCNQTTESDFWDDDISAIAWWSGNIVKGWWAIVWWESNTVNNWVVIWWNNNESNDKSVVLWENSKWTESSFVWNSENILNNSAVITASGWILIWTYTPISWVNLVVNGAVKLWSNNTTSWNVWEIRMQSWCFYAYDGNRWHVINKKPTDNCPNVTCEFETALLQEGDSIQAYTSIYSENCSENLVNISCNSDWTLWEGISYYSYCYNLNWYGLLTPSCWEANRQTYPEAPTSNLCNVWTSSEIEDTETWYAWECSYWSNKVSCSAFKWNYCTWDTPTWEWVIAWPAVYYMSPQFTQWRYTSFPWTTPAACQWTCDYWYQPNEQGNGCFKP